MSRVWPRVAVSAAVVGGRVGADPPGPLSDAAVVFGRGEPSTAVSPGPATATR